MSRYGISTPTRDVNSLQRVDAQLKEAVEAILGYRGNLYTEGSIGDFEALIREIRALRQTVDEHSELIEFLYDWVYAHGYTDPTPFVWAPGTTSPVDATRLPVHVTDQLSNMIRNDIYGFVPIFGADYLLKVDLRFVPDQNNRDWEIAVFDNGVQTGASITFNSREEPVLQIGASLGVPLDAGDVLDLRLWPTNAGSTGSINVFSIDLSARGVREGDVLRR